MAHRNMEAKNEKARKQRASFAPIYSSKRSHFEPTKGSIVATHFYGDPEVVCAKALEGCTLQPTVIPPRTRNVRVLAYVDGDVNRVAWVSAKQHVGTKQVINAHKVRRISC